MAIYNVFAYHSNETTADLVYCSSTKKNAEMLLMQLLKKAKTDNLKFNKSNTGRNANVIVLYESEIDDYWIEFWIEKHTLDSLDNTLLKTWLGTD